MLPHLIIHGVGVAICFVAMLVCLYGFAGPRGLDRRNRAIGFVGLATLIIGGAIALASLIL
jgi:hypothetical protein